MTEFTNKMTKEEFDIWRAEQKKIGDANRERIKQERAEEREKNRLAWQAKKDGGTSDQQETFVPEETTTVNAAKPDDVDTQKPTSVEKKTETQQQLQQQNEEVVATESSTDGTTTPPATETIAQVNPLHDYAPYNYIITLSCLSKDEFNQGLETDGVVIARSAGKGTTGAPPLDKDFYLNNLVIRNTISPTKAAGTGAVYQVLFDITEPYGVSFVDALILAADMQGYNNHLKAVYQLKIEFKGIDDDGLPTNIIPLTTRTIPIHITAVELNIDAGVSTYSCTAFPTTNLAFTDLHGKTKEAYTIGGETVEQVLNNFFEAITRTQKNLVTQQKQLLPDEYALATEQSKPIIKTKIGYDAKSQSKNVVNYSYIYDTATHKTFYRGISVPKGTDIQAFIEAIIRESDYYKDQFFDDMTPKKDTMTIARVFPQLEILSDDNGNNRPQYRFRYVVRTQDVTAAYFSKTPEDLTKDLVPMRTYDYLYTGKNQDVLNFDITYKFAYYQTIPYNSNTTNDPQTDNYDGTKDETGDADQTGTGNKGVSQTTKEAEEPAYNNGLTLAVNKKNGEIGRIFEQIIADPSADLIVSSLEIIGDPYWIAQKEVSNRSFKLSHSDTPNTDVNGAVATDESEIFIELNFRTPQDLDDETGLFLNSERVRFSGKYKVFICANRFADGVFTNELEMVRMKFQEEDEPEAVAGKAYGNAGASKGGMQSKQGVGRYDPTKPAFLTDLGASSGSNTVSEDNTGDNVTKVPVGSNISRQYTGANRGGFSPDGFDVTDRLPDPKIDIKFTGNKPKYSQIQLELLREFDIKPDPSRLPNGN